MKKKIIASVVAVGALVAMATPADAASMWVNGWVRSSSTCSSIGSNNCYMDIMFSGGSVRNDVGINEDAPIYNCNSLYGHPYGIPQGGRLGTYETRLETNNNKVPNSNFYAGAKVTIQYGTTPEPQYIRCI